MLSNKVPGLELDIKATDVANGFSGRYVISHLYNQRQYDQSERKNTYVHSIDFDSIFSLLSSAEQNQIANNEIWLCDINKNLGSSCSKTIFQLGL